MGQRGSGVGEELGGLSGGIADDSSLSRGFPGRDYSIAASNDKGIEESVSQDGQQGEEVERGGGGRGSTGREMR